MVPSQSSTQLLLPTHVDLFYGGRWHPPIQATSADTYNPATGEVLGRLSEASAQDDDAAVEAAHAGYSPGLAFRPSSALGPCGGSPS